MIFQTILTRQKRSDNIKCIKAEYSTASPGECERDMDRKLKCISERNKSKQQ